MKAINIGLRFLLELSLLGVFGYWGFQASSGAMRWVIGIGTPTITAIVWGILIAPHSERRLSDPMRLGIEIGLFALATVALWYSQQHALALVFAIVVVVNLVLMLVWQQRH